jgi:Acetyltransferase (GNAT) domain
VTAQPDSSAADVSDEAGRVLGAEQVMGLSPAPRAIWRAVLDADADALPEHAPEWVDAICSRGGYVDASRLYQFDNGRQFVLPLVRRTGVAGIGGRLASYPSAWGIGGLVGAGQDAEVLKPMVDDLRASREVQIGIRPDPTKAALWSAAASGSVTIIPRRAHVVDLTGGFAAVKQRMHRATGKYVRRAQRAGVQVRTQTGGALLDEYYNLYLASISRWATRQHEPLPLARWRALRRDPLAKLETMARHLGPSFVIVMAFVAGRPAFGSIMLLGNTAHVTRSAMDIDLVGPSKAGSLVHWTMMRLACDHGCARYHLGESGDSRSLAQFKEGFGAEPVPYAEYRFERLPVSRADQAARSVVKRLLRFRDV